MWLEYLIIIIEKLISAFNFLIINILAVSQSHALLLIIFKSIIHVVTQIVLQFGVYVWEVPINQVGVTFLVISTITYARFIICRKNGHLVKTEERIKKDQIA